MHRHHTVRRDGTGLPHVPVQRLRYRDDAGDAPVQPAVQRVLLRYVGTDVLGEQDRSLEPRQPRGGHGLPEIAGQVEMEDVGPEAADASPQRAGRKGIHVTADRDGFHREALFPGLAGNRSFRVKHQAHVVTAVPEFSRQDRNVHLRAAPGQGGTYLQDARERHAGHGNPLINGVGDRDRIGDDYGCRDGSRSTSVPGSPAGPDVPGDSLGPDGHGTAGITSTPGARRIPSERCNCCTGCRSRVRRTGSRSSSGGSPGSARRSRLP